MDNYYLKSLSEDNELMAESKYMKEILLTNEEILYSKKIQRIKKGAEEEIIIVLSDRYVYGIKGKKARHKVDIRNITGITLSKKEYEIDIKRIKSENSKTIDNLKKDTNFIHY